MLGLIWIQTIWYSDGSADDKESKQITKQNYQACKELNYL